MRFAVYCTLVGSLLAQAGSRIETAVGSGQSGYSGDGGKAVEARLNQPFHCELDAAGDLYIAEAFNHCIRKVNLKNGLVTTVAGTGKKGYSGDGGKATVATLNEPYAVVAQANGDLYIVDRLNAVIRMVDASTGGISTVAGTGTKGFSGDGGKATEARLTEPNDCCLDGNGGLLIADVGDWRVRRLDLKTGLISTYAGTGRPKGKVTRAQIGDGGPASNCVVVGARAVCVDGLGNTFICEREGNAIRKVDDRGIITTVAGTGEKGYDGDGGEAKRATFSGPKGIRCDRHGNVYVVDTENHAIRMIEVRTGKISTVAGGRKGGAGDGAAATGAGLDRPHGCIISPGGAIYIADSNNHRVRKVAPP